MIKVEKFLVSKALYAIKPDSLRQRQPDATGYSGWWMVDAVWFKRKHGITSANIGTLVDLRDTPPVDLAQFLADHRRDPCGGRCDGRWDGVGYWGDQVSLDVQRKHLEILRPMLASYPGTPRGYEGWWKFE